MKDRRSSIGDEFPPSNKKTIIEASSLSHDIGQEMIDSCSKIIMECKELKDKTGIDDFLVPIKMCKDVMDSISNKDITTGEPLSYEVISLGNLMDYWEFLEDKIEQGHVFKKTVYEIAIAYLTNNFEDWEKDLFKHDIRNSFYYLELVLIFLEEVHGLNGRLDMLITQCNTDYGIIEDSI